MKVADQGVWVHKLDGRTVSIVLLDGYCFTSDCDILVRG